MRLEVACWAFETYGGAYYISPLHNLRSDSLIFTHRTKKKLYPSEMFVCKKENGQVDQTLLSKRENTLFYQNNWMGAKWKQMS